MVRIFLPRAILLFLALAPFSAWAVDPFTPLSSPDNVRIEGETLFVTDAGGASKKFPLLRVKQGQRVYHWTQLENQVRWVKQGFIDQGEIDFLATPSGTQQVYGPGMYFSEHPYDTRNFGPAGIYTEAQMDHWVLDGSIKITDPKQARETFAKLRALGVYGTQVNAGNYRVYFDAAPVSKVASLDAVAILDHFNKNLLSAHPFKLLVEISDFAELPSGHPFLQKHLPALAKAFSANTLNPEETAELARMVELAKGTKFELQMQRRISSELRQKLLVEKIKVSKNPIADLLYFDQKIEPVKDFSFLNSLESPPSPLAKFTNGASLTAAERASLWAGFQAGPISLRETPLRRAIAREFRPELRDWALKNQRVDIAQLWGLFSSDLQTSAPIPAPTLSKDALVVDVPLEKWARDYITATEFIDRYDLALAQAQDHPAPWTLYDQPGAKPLLDGWREAKQQATANGRDVLRVAGTLSGKPVDFRDHPVTAGGDIEFNGKKYFRLTQGELENLRGNPLLEVEAVSDPWPQHPGMKTFLARYTYPDAGSFRKFEIILPDDLRAELEAAEKAGHLKNPNHPLFRSLTKKVLAALWDTSYSQSNPLDRYRRQMAIHPLSDLNGRALRALYAAQVARAPLSLDYWDADLLSSNNELKLLANLGENARERFVSGINIEAGNVHPQYYSRTELFDSLLDLPAEPIGDPNQRRADMANFLQAHKEMIKKKEIRDLSWRLWDHKIEQLLGMKDPGPVLLAWMEKGVAPLPRDEKLYRRLLELGRSVSMQNPEIYYRWLTQLTSGREPAYGKVLASWIEQLPPREQGLFLKEFTKSYSDLNLSFSEKFSKKLEDHLRAELAQNGADSPKAYLHLLKRFVREAEKGEAPSPNLLRLLASEASGKEEVMLATGTLLRDSPPTPGMLRLAEAYTLVPKAPTDTYLAYQIFEKVKSHPRYEALAERIVLLPDGNLSAIAWRDLRFQELVKKPALRKKIMAQINHTPENKNNYAKLRALREISVEDEKRVLQSLFDSGNWTGIKSTLPHVNFKENTSTSTDFLSHRKLYRAGLEKMLRESPDDAVFIHRYLIPMSDTPEGKTKALERAIPAIKNCKNARECMSLADEILEGNLTPALRKKLNQSVVEAALQNHPDTALGILNLDSVELSEWRPDWQASLERITEKKSIDQSALLKFLKKADSVPTGEKIIRSLLPALQQDSLKSNFDYLPPRVLAEAIRKSDKKFAQEFINKITNGNLPKGQQAEALKYLLEILDQGHLDKLPYAPHLTPQLQWSLINAVTGQINSPKKSPREQILQNYFRQILSQAPDDTPEKLKQYIDALYLRHLASETMLFRDEAVLKAASDVAKSRLSSKAKEEIFGGITSIVGHFGSSHTFKLDRQMLDLLKSLEHGPTQAFFFQRVAGLEDLAGNNKKEMLLLIEKFLRGQDTYEEAVSKLNRLIHIGQGNPKALGPLRKILTDYLKSGLNLERRKDFIYMAKNLGLDLDKDFPVPKIGLAAASCQANFAALGGKKKKP